MKSQQTLGLISTTSTLSPFSHSFIVVEAHELSSSRSPRNSDTRLSLDSTPRVRVAISARRMSQRVRRMSSLALMVSELGLEIAGLTRSLFAVCWMLFFVSSLSFCSLWTPCKKPTHHCLKYTSWGGFSLQSLKEWILFHAHSPSCVALREQKRLKIKTPC